MHGIYQKNFRQKIVYFDQFFARPAECASLQSLIAMKVLKSLETLQNENLEHFSERTFAGKGSRLSLEGTGL